MRNDWLRFYTFARDPFGSVHDPEHLFQPESRQGLVAGLLNDVLTGAPVVTLRGDQGLGKSSLARLVAMRLREHGLPVVEAGAATTTMQLQSLLAEAAGLANSGATTPDQLLQALRLNPKAARMAVVVDDADRLPVAGFRMLALLQSLFASQTMALRLVLVGTPGRWPGLDQPDLQELRQQSISQWALFPLREEECRGYLTHKFRLAGVRLSRVMSNAAVVALSRQADGVPSRLDSLARDMLDAAFRRRRRRITLRFALPTVSPDRGWTMPLTLAALRSPWLAAFAVLLLAGGAGFAFMRRDSLAASPDLQVATHALASALSWGEAQVESPQPRPVSLAARTVPSPSPPQAAVPPGPAPMTPTPGPERPLFAEGPAPADPARPGLAQAEPKLAESVSPPPAPAEPATVGVKFNAFKLVPPLVPQQASAVPAPPQMPSLPVPPPHVAARIEASRAEPDATEGRELPPGLPASSVASQAAAVQKAPAPKKSPPPPHGGPGLMLMAGEADTLPALYARVYRGVVPPPYAALVAANQGPIKPGMLLIFPEPPNGWATH